MRLIWEISIQEKQPNLGKDSELCGVLTYPIPTPTYSPSLCGNLKSHEAHKRSTFKQSLSSHRKKQSMFEAPPKNPVLEN